MAGRRQISAAEVYALGNAAAARGDWWAAINSWVAAAHAVADPDSTHALLRLLIQRDPARDADAMFSKAAPTPLKSTIGALLMDLDGGAAERWLREAADEGDSSAAYNLGVLLDKRGATDAARQWWEAAVGGDDEAVRAKAANNLGVACLRAHNLEGAERWFASVAEDHPPAANNLAIVLQSLGRTDEARAWSERAAGMQQLTAWQRVSLAARVHMPAAAPCPTCGAVPSRPLPLRLAPLTAPPEVDAVLTGEPLASACENCGTRFDAHLVFAFVDEQAGVAIAAPADRLPESVRDALAAACERVVLRDSVPDGIEAVAAHVRETGAWLVDGFRAAGDEAAWVRSQGEAISVRALIAAGLLVNGDADGVAAMQELTALRALTVAGAAIADGVPAPARLDAQVPVWASGHGDRRLREAAGGEGRLAAALALAWVADRGGPALDEDGHRAWAAAVLDRLIAVAPPADVAVFGDPDFLARTLDPGMLLAAFDDLERAGGPTRAARAAIERYDLLGGMSLASFQRLVADEATVDEVATGLTAGSTADNVASRLHWLVELGRLDDAEALYGRHPGDPDAAILLGKALNDADRPQAAIDIVTRVLSGPPLEPDVQCGLGIVLAEAHQKLLQHPKALAIYELVESILVPRPEWRQRLCEVRLMKAKSLRYQGRLSDARDLLEELLGEQLPLTLRFDVLTNLADVLASEGDFEAALMAQRRAAQLGEPIGGWRRDAYRDLRIDQLQTQAALGWDREVLAEGAEMLALLGDGDRLEQAQLRTLMAEAAARGGDAPTAAEHAAHGLAVLAQLPPPGHELARRGREQVHARLLAAAGRADELERLIAASPTRSWMLPELLAKSRVQRRAWAGAREATTRSWTVLLEQLLADRLSERRVHGLRITAALQRVTGEIALAQTSEEDLLWAGELQAGFLSGLVAWPTEERHAVAGQLVAPGHTRAWLDRSTLTVTTVAGLDDVLLIAWRDDTAFPLGRWARGALDRVRREVAAVTKRGDPRGDPLARSPAWNSFAAAAGGVLAAHLPAAHLLFAGTALQGIPLHMLPFAGRPLCRSVPCSYTPSLLSLAGLRRSAAPRAERPRVGVLSVVRVRELEAAAAAFAAGAQALAAAARRHKSAVEVLSGPAASPSALGDLLGRVDIACVSCHGLARPGFGSHALLLADGATLPPQLVDVDGSARFVLDWERIPAAVPAAVLSTACSSGSGSTVEGGERVALDRSFLARGTRVFVGPLWDVGIAEGLELAAAVLERRLAGRGWAEGWMDVLCNAGDELPSAAWAGFVTVGDWRT